MGDENRDGEAITRIKEIEEKLKNNGFASVDALLGEFHTVSEERDKAVEARDKFHADNDDARKIIQRKASENDALKKQIEDMKAGKEVGEKTEEVKNDPEKSAKTPPPPPQKTPEEEAAELEDSLSDEQREAAEAMYAEADEDLKARLATDPSERLKVLRIVTSNIKTVPESFFQPKKETKETKKTEDEVTQLWQRLNEKHNYAPFGPSAPSSTGKPRTGNKGGYISPSQANRPVDQRVA